MNKVYTLALCALLSSGYGLAIDVEHKIEENKITVTCNETQNNKGDTTVKYEVSPNMYITLTNICIAHCIKQYSLFPYNSQYDKDACLTICNSIQNSKTLSDLFHNLRIRIAQLCKDKDQQNTESLQKVQTENLISRTVGHIEGALVGATATAIAVFIYNYLSLKQLNR